MSIRRPFFLKKINNFNYLPHLYRHVCFVKCIVDYFHYFVNLGNLVPGLNLYIFVFCI